jgi:acyl-CoA synthetase (AMP-forming)/AMP-acid ligase II
MSAALPVRPDSIGLSWLPLHHDMGLVGGLLIPFHNGFPIYLIGTTDFRNRPWIWLEAMAQLRATICAAPPSAYAVCTKLAARATRKCLDLGAWECALVGAEPISAGTLRRFAAAFASCGFRADALFPVYGLAEATLAVTCPRIRKPPCIDRVDRASVEKYDFAIPSDDADTLEFVSVGAPLPGTEVRIADRNGGPLPERRIGEILVRSATIMEGYVGEQDGTAPIRDGWLQTGDLGYFVEGDLFITGRIKDLIIHGGQNLIPAVLEEIVAAVDGVRAGGAAAIGVRSAELGTEEVCVVAETPLAPAEYPELVTRIREALSGYGVALDRVLLIPPRALPRTTSGKPRRQPLARALASGCPTDVTALGSEQ